MFRLFIGLSPIPYVYKSPIMIYLAALILQFYRKVIFVMHYIITMLVAAKSHRKTSSYSINLTEKIPGKKKDMSLGHTYSECECDCIPDK